MRPPCVNSFDASPPKKATQLIALQAASAPSTTKPRRERSRRICIRMVVLPPSESELEREGHCRRRRQLIGDQREELVHVVARADQLRVERGELAVRPAPDVVE